MPLALVIETPDGGNIRFDAPDDATPEQLVTLANRALGKTAKKYPRPVLEKSLRQFVSQQRPKAELKATPQTIGSRIEGGIKGALSAFGVDERYAQHVGSRAASFLNDLTPVGDVATAESAWGDFQQGRYLPALGKGALAALGSVPGMGDAASGAAKAIIAPLWHGSPHKFDKFSLGHIGKGEGNQAYGHGLYFAENRDVARGYQKDLTTGRLSTMQRNLDAYGGDIDRAITAVERDIDRLLNLPNAGNDAAMRDRFVRLKRGALEELSALKATGELNTGHLYEVQVDAEPRDFLDYDTPAIRQPQAVRDILEVPMETPRWEDRELGGIMKDALKQSSRKTPDDVSMMIDNDYDLYTRAHNFARSTMPAAQYKEAEDYGQSVGDYLASLSEPQFQLLAKQYAAGDDLLALYRGREEALRRAGVPGARYLDGYSRADGTGSSNYVVFDDSLVDILRRY